MFEEVLMGDLSQNGGEVQYLGHNAPLPFTMADLRAAIPKHCWLKDTKKSLSFFLRDTCIIILLALLAGYLNNSLIWPFYWITQGTLFWSLFVVGHDCGHGSFSNNQPLNDLIGHLAHSFLLVPYHGWRISHRRHHKNHGHVENDESWHPIIEKNYKEMGSVAKAFRFSPALLLMFAFPIYLCRRSPNKFGSHFHPDSPLFKPTERKMVLTSTTCWALMLTLLAYLSVIFDPSWILKLHVIPDMIGAAWLVVVTYLHHHGYKKEIAWYRGKEWSFIRGGLSTIDRDYGLLNSVMHDINTHVVHHLFPQIPHYHLIEATRAIKPILGHHYREPHKSRFFPHHLFKELFLSLAEDHFVDDEGDVVFYKSALSK